MSTTSTNGHRSFTKEGTPPSIIPLNGMRMLKPYAGGGGRNPILPYSPSPRQHQHYHFAPSSPHSHSPSPSAAVAKQAAPMVAGFQNHNAEMPDLEGGTLLDVKEVEEIDPEDGCKVFVTTYHILSADGTEESMITKHRKLKVNCTQSLRRVEYLNGKESKFEEKTTILDGLDAFNVIDPTTMEQLNNAADFGGSGDSSSSVPLQSQQQQQQATEQPQQSIGDVLVKTQDGFLTLLHQKKDKLVEMFPELFSNLRTQPAIFNQIPSTQTETVMNEDGSTVTRTMSSKAFSTKFTRHEMYINGVPQETQQCFRAFMEYAGPDGGFRIRLSDNADAELSEGEEEDYRGGRSMIVGGPSNYSAQRALPAPPPPPEAEEEEAEGSSEEKHPMESYYSLMPPSENAENHNNRNNGTTASPLRLGVEGIEEGKVKTVAKRLDSVSRSGLSEIPDTVSAVVVSDGGARSRPKMLVAGPTGEPMRRHEKAWHAVTEMVESEKRYVQKLALLEHFRDEVERAHIVDKKQMTLLFANISSLHSFHNDHLLPQLMDRHREWQQTMRISDVLRKQAPFLKMYSEYTNNYKKATAMFELCRKKRSFEEIVRRMERLPECDGLSLVSHFICPVQRVMRYQLLLKEYQRHLTKTDADYVDTETALTLVIAAASHANEMMRKLDRYKHVLEVQEQLGNSVSLVSPSRDLLKKTKLGKISSSTERVEDRVLFVFSDLFLLASERSTLISGIGTGRYKLRAIFDAYFTKICEGNNLEREHSFYIRGADSATGPLRCVELFCANQHEKNTLFETIWNVIEECHAKRDSSSSASVEPSPPPASAGNIPVAGGNRNSGSPASSGVNEKGGNCFRCETEFKWHTKAHFCARCSQRFCRKCFGPPKKCRTTCLECKRTQEGGVRACSEDPPRTTSTATAAAAAAENVVAPSTPTKSSKITINPRVNVLAVPATKTEDVIKGGFVHFHGPSGGNKQLHRYFVLRRDFCLYSYTSDKDRCALSMLPMSGCNIDLRSCSSERLSFSIRHVNRTYVVQCSSEADHAEWMAAMLLSANAKLPGEMINAQQGEVPGPKGKKHSLVFGRSLRSPSPSIMKRSASVNDQQRPMELGLGGIDEIAQMNAKNSAHKQPPVKRRDPNPKKFF